MVGPARKREAVEHVQRSVKISERRACRVLGQSRSTQRYEVPEDEEEKRLISAMRRLAREYPRWGHRRMGALLRAEGWKVNHKRVQRLWRAEGLRVMAKARKQRRLGKQRGEGSQHRRAVRPGEVWAYDFVFDQTRDGRRLKILMITDEFTRECLAVDVRRHFTACEVQAVLARLIAERGAPAHLRSDNGPEFIAAALKKWVSEKGFQTLYIDPGSPWQNAFVESLNNRVRDELLNTEMFCRLKEAQVLAEDWRVRYNGVHPHSGLGMQSPGAFAGSWQAPVGPSATPQSLPAPASFRRKRSARSRAAQHSPDKTPTEILNTNQTGLS